MHTCHPQSCLCRSRCSLQPLRASHRHPTPHFFLKEGWRICMSHATVHKPPGYVCMCDQTCCKRRGVPRSPREWKQATQSRLWGSACLLANRSASPHPPHSSSETRSLNESVRTGRCDGESFDSHLAEHRSGHDTAMQHWWAARQEEEARAPVSGSLYTRLRGRTRSGSHSARVKGVRHLKNDVL